MGKINEHCDNRGHVAERLGNTVILHQLLDLERLLLEKLNSFFCNSQTFADHAHIFWSCPSIHFFWREVAKMILKVPCFNMNVLFTTQLNMPDGLSRAYMYLCRVFLAASKKAITKCWLQKNAPTT